MAKKGFLEGYKIYNPEEEGYGDPEQWQQSFSARMGYEKAKEFLGETDPYSVLGILSNSTWEIIKSAYRKMAMKWHPDRNIGDSDAVKMFKKVQAAYEVLEKKHGH